jgi:hypothetical protein
MSEAFVTVRNASTGDMLFEHQLDRNVAQVINKALLLGRREFTAPQQPAVATLVLKEFDQWFGKIQEMIEEGCRSSALGTSYEDYVRKAVFQLLGVHPQVEEKELYGDFSV